MNSAMMTCVRYESHVEKEDDMMEIATFLWKCDQTNKYNDENIDVWLSQGIQSLQYRYKDHRDVLISLDYRYKIRLSCVAQSTTCLLSHELSDSQICRQTLGSQQHESSSHHRSNVKQSLQNSFKKPEHWHAYYSSGTTANSRIDLGSAWPWQLDIIPCDIIFIWFFYHVLSLFLFLTSLLAHNILLSYIFVMLILLFSHVLSLYFTSLTSNLAHGIIRTELFPLISLSCISLRSCSVPISVSVVLTSQRLTCSSLQSILSPPTSSSSIVLSLCNTEKTASLAVSERRRDRDDPKTWS